MYLNKFIPDGFTEIKQHMFSNEQEMVYRAAHSQVTCTKMVGLYRLSHILDKMQKCVYKGIDQSSGKPIIPKYTKY